MTVTIDEEIVAAHEAVDSNIESVSCGCCAKLAALQSADATTFL
jgi:hypothetical protein